MTRDFSLANRLQNSQGVSLRMYADDISASIAHRHRRKARLALQKALFRFCKWCKLWKFTISVSKSFTISFSRRRGSNAPLQLEALGERIPDVEEGKFLGIIFDRKLSRRPHVLELLGKVAQRHNLFKILLRRSMNLKPKLLINLYLALVRSIMDYSYPVILQSSSSLVSKLDIIQNSILRSILLASKSTPRAHVWLDSGLCPIRCRCEWLACQYVRNLNFKTNNPFYKNASQTYNSLTFWKPRSTPNILVSKSQLSAYGISLFQLHWNLLKLREPPWITPKIPTFLFPFSKKFSSANQTHAKILFRQLYPNTNNADDNSISIFSDGSVNL
ncbi:Pol-like protein, partial [Daphnia magna]